MDGCLIDFISFSVFNKMKRNNSSNFQSLDRSQNSPSGRDTQETIISDYQEYKSLQKVAKRQERC